MSGDRAEDHEETKPIFKLRTDLVTEGVLKKETSFAAEGAEFRKP